MNFIYKSRLLLFIIIFLSSLGFPNGNAFRLKIDYKNESGEIDRALYSLVGIDNIKSQGSEKAADALERLNIKGTQARLGAGIMSVEPENDDNDPFHFNLPKFNFQHMFYPNIDSMTFIDDLKRQNVEPVILFCYNSFWLGEKGSVTAPPANYDEWAEYVAAVVEFYNGNPKYGNYRLKIKYIEIWNEPSEGGIYWSGDRFQFCRLFNTTAERIHRDYPGVMIGGPTLLNGTDSIFLKDFFRLCGKNLDFITYHIYGESPKSMVNLISSWTEYARKITGKKSLKMMLTETDNIAMPDSEKYFYIIDRQLSLLNIGEYLLGVHHFCANAYMEGDRPFGIIYPGGGVIEKNYLPYYLMRNLEGKRLALQTGQNEAIKAIASSSQNGEKINLVLLNNDDKIERKLALDFALKPGKGSKILLIEKMAAAKMQTVSSEIIHGEKEKFETQLTLQPKTAYSILILPQSDINSPAADFYVDKTALFMGDKAEICATLINTLPYPISGEMKPANLPDGWECISAEGGAMFSELKTCEKFSARFTLKANTPVDLKDGKAIWADVFWGRGDNDRANTASTIAAQIFVASPIVFDALPNLIYMKPGEEREIKIGLKNIGDNPVGGALSLSCDKNILTYGDEKKSGFLADKNARVIQPFIIKISPNAMEGKYNLQTKCIVAGAPIVKNIEMSVLHYDEAQNLNPIDLRRFFNADTLTFSGNCSDLLNFGGMFSIPAEYFPDAGVADFLGVKFLIPDKADRLTNCVRTDSQQIEIPPDKYENIYILATATNGAKQLDMRLLFADGGEDTAKIKISDWCSSPTLGETSFAIAPYRHNIGGALHDASPRIFFQKIPILSKKAIKQIVLPATDDLYIYSMTLQASGEDPAEKLQPGNIIPTEQSEPKHIVFEADFKKQKLSEDWIQIGSVEPFNKLNIEKGAMNLEGGIGNEWFGAAYKYPLDLAKGTLMFNISYTHNAGNPWSEICFYFIKEHNPDKNPWNRDNFLRFVVCNTKGVGVPAPDVLTVQRDFGGGVGKILGVCEGLEMGKKYNLEIQISRSQYLVKLNGEQVLSGSHNMTWTEGYFYIVDGNSLKGDVDLIHSFKILQSK